MSISLYTTTTSGWTNTNYTNCTLTLPSNTIGEDLVVVAYAGGGGTGTVTSGFVSSQITTVTGNGSLITYNANNYFSVGDVVTIYGVSTPLNFQNVTIVSGSSTGFVVSGTNSVNVSASGYAIKAPQLTPTGLGATWITLGQGTSNLQTYAYFLGYNCASGNSVITLSGIIPAAQSGGGGMVAAVFSGTLANAPIASQTGLVVNSTAVVNTPLTTTVSYQPNQLLLSFTQANQFASPYQGTWNGVAETPITTTTTGTGQSRQAIIGYLVSTTSGTNVNYITPSGSSQVVTSTVEVVVNSSYPYSNGSTPLYPWEPQVANFTMSNGQFTINKSSTGYVAGANNTSVYQHGQYRSSRENGN